MDLFIDGQYIRTITDAPYKFTIQGLTQYGYHIITVRATDWHGQVSSSDVPIQYINPFGGGGVQVPVP